DVMERMMKYAAGRKNKDIVIKAFTEWESCCIDDIDAIWTELYRNGIFCHLVIIDYLDLMKVRPSLAKKFKDEYGRQTAVARDIKSFALKRNVAVWTATQTNRGINNEDPNFVITEKNISDDYGIFRVVDVPISINATTDELDGSTMRIHQCRGRRTKGGA